MDNLIFHSRPRAQADWKCNRARFYAYDFEGGIVKDNLSVDLFIGSTLHDALAAIASQHLAGKVDITKIATISRESVYNTLYEYIKGQKKGEDGQIFALEQATLVDALIRGFYKITWPNLIAQYPKVLFVEQEMIYPHDGNMIFMAKPDQVISLILESEDGGNIYLEFKSTSNKKLEWINSWNKNIQVHATMKVIEHHIKKEVLGTIIQGLYKGYTSYGKFSSQLVYCYKRAGNPPFITPQISAEWKAGSKRFPIWELDGGAEEWIETIPIEILADQFPRTPLIFPDESLTKAFFSQRTIREREVQDAIALLENPGITAEKREQILNTYFPQNFDACAPAWGSGCQYYNICHGPAREDPLSHGFLVRDRNHEQPYVDLAEQSLA